MADSFDPYLRWLGIRDPQRPPNHYRLLGLELFESDNDIIAVAADRQMAHVRTFQTGQLAALSQRLLNELAAARICLLKPEKKAAYDAQLKSQLGAVPVAGRPKPEPDPAAPVASLPVATRISAAHSDDVPGVGGAVAAPVEFPDFGSLGSATSASGLAASPATNKSSVKKSAIVARKKKSLGPWIGLVAAGTLLVIGVVVLQSMNDPTHVATADGSNGRSPAATIPVPSTTKATPSNSLPPKENQGSDVRGQGTGNGGKGTGESPQDSGAHTADHGNNTPTPSSGAAPSPSQKGPRAEPPVHSPRDVALVDNPLQHDPSDKPESPDKAANPNKTDQPARTKAAPVKPAVAGPAKPELPAVPDKEALAAAEKTIQSIYKSDFEQASHGGPDARAALAKQLVARGIETSDNSAARYVLLTRARDMAVAGGDVAIASNALKKLAELYAMDRPEEQPLACFSALAKTVRTREAAEALRIAAERAADAAFVDDNYELAGKFARLAMGVATKLRDQVAAVELKAKLAEIEQCKKEFSKLTDILARLKADPDDADANLAAGRFFGFSKGDFDKALPYLLKSNDISLKDLAKKDLSAPVDPADQAKVGDAWWTLAESMHEPAKSHLQAHAATWYSKAAPKLKGLTKGEAESRLKEVETTSRLAGMVTRVLILRILTNGEWQVHFIANPAAANGTDRAGYQYLHYRFLDDGSVKNEVTPPGHWTFDGDMVSVSYDGWTDVLHKFRVVGNSLQAEAYRPPDPELRNRGIGSKAQ